MKFLFLLASSLSLCASFQPSSHPSRPAGVASALQTSVKICPRQDFFKQVTAAGVAVGVSFMKSEPAAARGRATLEKSFERYAPRVRAGGKFYATELRALVGKNDWVGIKNALQEPPERKKEDLVKADAGVAARAKQAGGFSDARVLVAADLLAGSFSDNSIAPKTRKMQAAVADLREIVKEMQKVSRQGLGEEKGGLFGLGAKKPNEAELSKKMKELYVKGGNAWNEYVLAANDELALQFERFEYIK
jgi:hypothetical protein